jgi:hypothetical protein
MTNRFMKYRRLLAIAGLFLVTGGCTSSRMTVQTYRGQLVAAYCAFAVVDIQNPDVFEEGVEWRDGSGTLHRNTFTVANICDFYKAGIRVGETFEYRLKQVPSEKDCEVCLGYMETPSLRKTIEVIRKTEK